MQSSPGTAEGLLDVVDSLILPNIVVDESCQLEVLSLRAMSEPAGSASDFSKAVLSM